MFDGMGGAKMNNRFELDVGEVWTGFMMERLKMKKPPWLKIGLGFCVLVLIGMWLLYYLNHL